MSSGAAESSDDVLLGVLEDARRHGFLGPGPVHEHVRHALAFLDLPAVTSARSAVDLGSGGGVPGLVLALRLDATNWVLVEAQGRRAAFLRQAIQTLDLGDRVAVFAGRAESAGRDRSLRAAQDLVVARSFGLPAITAECASPLLRVGGTLVVAEPPEGATDRRWPEAGIAQFGLVRGAGAETSVALQVLVQETLCPDAYPRRVGVPSKRPLFR